MLPLTTLIAGATADATQETAHHVSPAVTAFFGGLLVLMILCLAFEEKIHAKKSIITGAFAVVTLLCATGFGLLPFGPVVNVFHESIRLPVYIPAVDWGVIAIIVGASLFVDVTSKSGLFSWVALKLTKRSGGDPVKLLIYYGIMTVVFSAVLNNVTAMIIVGSLTGVSLKRLNREDKLLGFLMVEGLLTNIGGLLTLISSVPNIIVGALAGISFVRFFMVAAPFVVVATAVTLWMGMRAFGIMRLTSDEEKREAAELVAGFDENDGVPSRAFFNYSVALFLLLILCFALQSVLPLLDQLGMGFVAMLFAVIALVRYRHDVDKFYAGLDWDLIAFFASLFVVINVMEHARVLNVLGEGIAVLTRLGPRGGAAAILLSSGVASSVTDNIPLAAMLGKILHGMGDQASGSFWWGVIFGANLGGNITPIGSASTVVAVTMMHKYGIAMPFARFVVLAAKFAVVQMALATVYVVLVLGGA
jgi:Na+/H+ antiporter NhaD/arsenite permease-like protein